MVHSKSLGFGLVAVLLIGIGVYAYHAKPASIQEPTHNTPVTVTPTSTTDTYSTTTVVSDITQTKYITAVEWPTTSTVSNKPYACAAEKHTINGREYCVSAESEGAAGSVYTTYTYQWPQGNQTASVSFVLRHVQCANYDEPKQSECKQEQAAFNVDSAVAPSLNKAFNSVTVTKQKPMVAILHTSMGDITIELSDATPNTVANFVKLAQSGFYDGTKFHRVIEGFMNQGGDPLSKDDSKAQLWGTGGPGYTFADEIKPTNRNDQGTIAMANAGPNTNGSQFFINVAPNNFLDTKHTVFGKVTAGYNVVEAINQVPTGAGDRPLTAVTIKNITLK